MGKIKNIDYLHNKPVNSVKIEENAVVFMLETGEKITLFATEYEQIPLKTNAILERYAIVNPWGKGVNPELVPAGFLTKITGWHTDDAVTFECQIGMHLLEVRWRLLYCSRLYYAIDVE